MMLLLGAGGRPTWDINAKEYFDILDATGTPTTKPFRKDTNTFILQLKDLGIYQKFDRAWIFGTEYKVHARHSIKFPGAASAVTEVNGIGWSPLGYQGNGTTQYLNSNFNPFLHSVNYAQNSASMGVYITTNNASGGNEMGNIIGSNGAFFNPRTAGNLITGQIHTTLAITGTAVTDSLGLNSIMRTGATASGLYKNGVLKQASAAASAGPRNLNFFIFARNNSGAAATISPRRGAFAYVGAAIDQAQLYTVLQSYAVKRGFNV